MDNGGTGYLHGNISEELLHLLKDHLGEKGRLVGTGWTKGQWRYVLQCSPANSYIPIHPNVISVFINTLSTYYSSLPFSKWSVSKNQQKYQQVLTGRLQEGLKPFIYQFSSSFHHKFNFNTSNLCFGLLQCSVKKPHYALANHGSQMSTCWSHISHFIPFHTKSKSS